MKTKRIFTQLLMTLVLLMPTMLLGQGAAPSSHLYYSGGNSNSDIWMNSVLVPVTTTYTYYSVMGWNTGQEGGGYCGIQDHPNGKVFIFSLWDPSNHLPIVGVHAGPGTQIENFGGEGTGLKSWNFTLGWTPGKWYNLVTRVWQYNGHSYFGFWSQDVSSGKWTHLVTMDYPVANVTFKGNNDAFIEDWIGSGANIRKVLFKDAWQRSTTGTWKLQKAATFSSNSGDAYRNGIYNEAFNAGIENSSFFMQTGGNTTHSFPGRTTNLSISSGATTPTTVAGEISSFVASYNSSTKYVNVVWDVNQFKSPQYSYTFEVFNNAQFTGSPLVTVTNNVPHTRNFSANLSSLFNGVYYARFKIKDIFDNVSAVKTSVITIGESPLVAITSPANNTTLSIPVSTVIKATASSATTTISKVEFYQGNTKLGEDFSAPYEIMWNTSTKGAYQLSALAYDNRGRTGAAEINVNVNSVCTQLTGTAFGTSPAYLNGSSTYDKVFDGNINTFFDYSQANGGYAALDLGSAKVIQGINYYPRAGQSGRMNGGKFQASNMADFNSGVVDLYTISEQPSGNWHEVAVTNTNAYRYVRYLSPDGGYCNVAEIQFCGVASINQPPTVSLASPLNGSAYSAPASITINANAFDTDGNIAKVEFYNGTTLLNSDNTSPYSYTWTGIATGTYSLTAKAYDNSGAVTTSSVVSITVEANSTCNTGGIAFGTSPAYINGSSTFDKAFDGNTSTFFDYAQANGGYTGLDFGAGKAMNVTTISYFPRAAWASRMVGGKFQGSNTADFSSVVDLYTITSEPIYNVWTTVDITPTTGYRYVRYLSAPNGYCNVAEIKFCGDISASNNAPSVSIIAPGNGAIVEAPASITISANASDSDGSISKVEFYNGTTLLNTDITFPYSYAWTGVSAGTYNLTAKAYDNSGAVTTSAVVSITVNAGSTCTAPLWNPATAYLGGDLVQYGGIRYKANWWVQNKRPDLNNGGPGSGMPWTSLGACTMKLAAAEFEEQNSSFFIYPNPASDYLNIQAAEEIESIEIINVNGMVCVKESNSSKINIASLNPGLYLIRIHYNGETVVRRFNKQ